MKIKLYFLLFISFFLFQNADAQNDTLVVQRVKLVPESEVEKPKSSEANQNIDAEVQKLKEELNKKKEEKKEDAVVIVRSAKEIPKTPISKTRSTVVGMNMMTMVSRLVPFGNGIPISGPTSLMMRRYLGNRAFRLGIGLNASSDSENINAIIRIGSERKRELNEKFTFIRGVDFIFGSGSFNTPGFSFGNSGSISLGADLTFGLEYKFNKYVSVGTETLLFGGILASDFDSGLAVKIIPPIALYLNLKIN